MRLFQITGLMEGYKEAQADFSKTADPNEVKELLDRFKTAVNRNLVTGQERNIDYWRKQGFDNFKSFLTSAEQKITSRQAKGKSATTGKSIRVHEDDKWLVVVPLDKEASCFYGKDTAWCTTKPFANYYENYFYDKHVTLVYFLNKETSNKWAIAYHPDIDKREYFDQNDNSIDEVKFENQTGLDPEKFIKIIESHSEKIAEVQTNYKENLKTLREKISNKEISNEVENLLFNTKETSLVFKYLDYAKEQSGSAIRKIAENHVRTQIPRDSFDDYAIMFFNFDFINSSVKDKLVQDVVEHINTFDVERIKEWFYNISPKLSYPTAVEKFKEVFDSKIYHFDFSDVYDTPRFEKWLENSAMYKTRLRKFSKLVESSTDRKFVDYVTSVVTRLFENRSLTLLYQQEIVDALGKNKLANTKDLFYCLIASPGSYQKELIPESLFTQHNVDNYINKIDTNDRFSAIVYISRTYPHALSKQLVTSVLKDSGVLDDEITAREYKIYRTLFDIAGIRPAVANIVEDEEQVIARILKTGPSIKSELDSIVSKFPKSPKVIDAFLQVGLVPNITWNDTIGMLLLLTTKSDKVVQFLLSKGIVDRDDAYQKLEQLGVPVQNESIERIKKLAGLK